MLPAIHRLPIIEEISALWCEIARDKPELDPDAALAEAHATIPDLLAYAAEYEAHAQAMRDAARQEAAQ